MSRALRPLLALALAFGLGGSLEARAAGELAPDFTLQDVNSGAGQVKLSDHKGKVVLLSFWATWCQPCQVEMKALKELVPKYNKDAANPDSLVFLVVSTDDARARNMIKPTAGRAGFKGPILHDADSKVVSQYNPAKTLPYTVIIDKDGRIRNTHMGYNPGDEVRVEREICEALGLEGDACKAPAAQ
jgi:peroxiredoxin